MKPGKWDHSENIYCNNQKSHCNIRKSSIATFIKKLIAIQRKQQKGVRNSKEIGSRCRLLQPWPITSELA
jgi:hypothetical protein